jgi:hypothetical protein
MDQEKKSVATNASFLTGCMLLLLTIYSFDSAILHRIVLDLGASNPRGLRLFYPTNSPALAYQNGHQIAASAREAPYNLPFGGNHYKAQHSNNSANDTVQAFAEPEAICYDFSPLCLITA